MEYRYEAKKTVYKGFLFDSILEARTARFLDYMGINYFPHPYTNYKNWIPDFYIYGEEQTSGYYVEVKPFTSLNFGTDIKPALQEYNNIIFMGLPEGNKIGYLQPYPGELLPIFVNWNNCGVWDFYINGEGVFTKCTPHIRGGKEKEKIDKLIKQLYKWNGKGKY